MPNRIKIKRSYTANSVPLATDLETHEVAINYADGKLFTKDASGNIVTVTLGGSGGGGGSGLTWSSVPASATSSGTAGQIAYDGSYIYVATGANAWKRSALSTWSTDPYWSQVALLLRMDGTASAFTDSSSTTKTITAFGNAAHSAAQSRWGGASLYLDGAGDYLTAGGMPSIGSNDFSVEMWLYLVSSSSQYAGLYDQRNADDTIAPVIYLLYDALYYYVYPANRITGPALQPSTWHHIALARSSGTTRMYVNGAQVGSSWTDSTTYAGVATAFVGSLYNAFGTNAYIDDVRVTVGAARYTGSTITVPTAAFPNS